MFIWRRHANLRPDGSADESKAVSAVDIKLNTLRLPANRTFE